MQAAVVHRFDQPPVCAEFEPPVAAAGEVLVDTRSAAISQLVRAQAAGRHYSAGRQLPLVPGADGVGLLADGSRVYFAFPRAPVGSMAQRVAVRAENCVVVPDGVADVTAAALANPGMSSWAALTLRARLQPGETVLINGAGGVSGRLAIQIARHLGAGRIIVTARKAAVEQELRALGADEFILLRQPAAALVAAFAGCIEAGAVDIVLDYLWGEPAACIIKALGGHGQARAQPRLRFVNIGSLAGAELALPADSLRSSGLELMGSGLGSVAQADLVQAAGAVLRLAASTDLSIETRALPLAQVTQAWQLESAARVVLTL